MIMMKKLLTVCLLSLSALSLAAQRTPHAVGVHFGGSTMDFEYQYHFSNRNFLDVTAGVFDLDRGFTTQCVYNWNVCQWKDWTPNFASWKLWAGFGAGAGFYDHHDRDGFLCGPVGTVGFGFTAKDVPLTIGVDYRPMVAVLLGDDADIISAGFRNVGVTLTYRF